MNRSWFIFYGLQLGMTRQEVFDVPYGEMVDLINCLAIYNGGAEEKRKLTFDEILNLR